MESASFAQVFNDSFAFNNLFTLSDFISVSKSNWLCMNALHIGLKNWSNFFNQSENKPEPMEKIKYLISY